MAVTRLQINGKVYERELPRGISLLDALRDHFDLTGAKYGCGEGQCGACTVLVDERATAACIQPAAAVRGAITTIEGLQTAPDRLHPVQSAFLEVSAFQCGYCTPGMILGAVALLKEKPKPTPADVRSALERHVCRCGTYPRIVQAVMLASKAMPGERA